MRLTNFSDYALRVLMYAAAQQDRLITIEETADVYGISRAHLMKVVNRLTRAGYLKAVRGRSGGLALANTTATSLEMVGLMWLMRRRLGGLALARVWPGLARAAAGSALMGAALAAWLRLSAPLAGAWPAYAAWIVGLGGAALGGAVYAAAAFALRAPEAAMLVSMLRRRGEGE